MMNQRNSVDVSRASHVHHAPQIVFPQSGPVMSTTVVNTSPTSAALSATRSSFSSLSHRYSDARDRHQHERDVERDERRRRVDVENLLRRALPRFDWRERKRAHVHGGQRRDRDAEQHIRSAAGWDGAMSLVIRRV